MSLIHEKPDPFRALPHWCNSTQKQSSVVLTIVKNMCLSLGNSSVYTLVCGLLEMMRLP